MARIYHVHEQGPASGRQAADLRAAEVPGTPAAAADRLIRSLRTLGRCTGSLLRAADERQALDAVTAGLVETGGHAAAWIGIGEAGHRMAWFGRAGAGPMVERPDGPDTCCASANGSASLFPLIVDGQRTGCLWVQTADGGDLNEDERAHLVELADDLAASLADRRRRQLQDVVAMRQNQAMKMTALARLSDRVAHDFNNHFTVIISNLSLLADLYAEHADVHQMATTSLRRSRQAVELLGLLQKALNRHPARPAIRDVGKLVGLALERAGPGLGPQIRVVAPPPATIAKAAVDVEWLNEVLAELLTNAREAMPDGGDLTVAIQPETVAASAIAEADGIQPGRYVSIAIADTGRGMPADAAARAFDPFFTSKAGLRGAGLGLTRAYVFAVRSGGSLRLDSVPGSGTCVTLLLPRV